MKNTIRSFIIVALLVFTFSYDTFAARPRAREFTGVVTSLDLQSQEVSIDSQTFRLTPQTRFIAQDRFVEPSTLKPGETVKVHYRSPLIGKKLSQK